MLRPWLRAALLLAALPASAADLHCPALTRVGISDLGYSSFQERGAYRGTSVDVIAELGRRTGCRFGIEWYPRERLFVQFAKGQVDATMGSLRSPERDRAGLWVPYAYTQFELLLTSASAGAFPSLAEFVDAGSGRLNVTRGISYPPPVQAQLDRLQKQGRLEYVNDYEVVFRKIVAGRTDGTLAPPVIHRLHTQRFHLEGKLVALTMAEWPRKLVGIYLSGANLSAETRHAFARAIHDMVADGTVQKIYESYMGAEAAQHVFAGGVGEILDAVPR